MIGVGILLLKTSQSVQEVSIDYTDCEQSCIDGSCYCDLSFEVREGFNTDVYMYYVLEGYLQSHRRFAGSWDEYQQKGNFYATVDKSCYPFDYEVPGNSSTKPIAPCGIIANAIFNDTFSLNHTLLHPNPVDETNVKVVRREIAWSTDLAYKYRNPKDNKTWGKWSKPPNWPLPANQLDPNDPSNNGLLNEALLVWLRVGAFPRTRKFYGRVFTWNEVNTNYTEGLLPGNYSLKIEYNYNVKPFGGRKKFLLSTTSWFGGKSDFLGVTYLVVGTLTFLLALFLAVMYKFYGINQADIMNITRETPYEYDRN